MEREFSVLHGAAYFRYKIALATLTGAKLKLTDIRSEDINPGLTEYEANFLQLIQEITDGALVKINKTGTKVEYVPGAISNHNGVEVVHECHPSRSIVYYLEGILPIALFGKEPLEIVLTGVTNDGIDVSIDSFRAVIPVLLRQFGIEEGPSINLIERGIHPLGGGRVKVKLPIVKSLDAPHMTEEGKIKRIRGVAYACKTSPQLCNRMFETMRGIFIDYIPDVWIHTDHSKSGLSPGYGTSVVAETTTGVLFTADSFFDKAQESTPESVGKECALRLLDEALFGGCVDSSFQGITLLLMALSSNEHVASLKVGRVTKYSYCLF
jgi:RNA 3'-terminal phosphate cyclase-like protein